MSESWNKGHKQTRNPKIENEKQKHFVRKICTRCLKIDCFLQTRKHEGAESLQQNWTKILAPISINDWIKLTAPIKQKLEQLRKSDIRVKKKGLKSKNLLL